MVPYDWEDILNRGEYPFCKADVLALLDELIGVLNKEDAIYRTDTLACSSADKPFVAMVIQARDKFVKYESDNVFAYSCLETDEQFDPYDLVHFLGRQRRRPFTLYPSH